MSTGLENKIKFDFNSPNFQNKFGGKTGTVSEQRKEQEDKSNDVANIIGASAEGLDSVTNFVSLFTGKTPSPQANYTPAPPPQKKISPLVWIGGGAMVLLLIILLISSKNGQTAKQA
ncbi:hypothetical protein [Aureispira sp. CCB-QB1]|uniref:hypothetical protein n=1 Tax=Aureispira sp. CCB-QB1 TaxID=1313421 RepID=UPI000696DB82|nr:hypothetical protein [Aureispira sp. CCB-QB1]